MAGAEVNVTSDVIRITSIATEVSGAAETRSAGSYHCNLQHLSPLISLVSVSLRQIDNTSGNASAFMGERIEPDS